MENIKMIQKIARSFHKTSGLEYEELLGEATVAYFESIETYEPERGALSTWAWACMTKHLLYYLQTQIRWNRNKCPDPRKPMEWVDSHFLWEFMESLPKDSKLICKMILDSPEEFLGEARKETIGQVESYLRKQGWAWRKIRNGLQGIKKSLTETA